MASAIKPTRPKSKEEKVMKKKEKKTMHKNVRSGIFRSKILLKPKPRRQPNDSNQEKIPKF